MSNKHKLVVSLLMVVVLIGSFLSLSVFAATTADLLVMSSVIGGIGFQYSSGVARARCSITRCQGNHGSNSRVYR